MIPLVLLEALQAGESSEAVLTALQQRCQLTELLNNPSGLEAFLAAGLDPNSTVGGKPLLMVVMAGALPSCHESVQLLTAHGADWGASVPVVLGRWPDLHKVMVPVAHAMLYEPTESVYWPLWAIGHCGLDPALVDPEWGGNLAHHAALGTFFSSSCYDLERAGVDLDQVAEGDEAMLAWAKMTGGWMPAYAGKTARQVCGERSPGCLERAKAQLGNWVKGAQ